MRSHRSETSVVSSIPPDTNRTATTTGAAVDLLGFESCLIVFVANTVADGVWTPSFQVSDDGTNWIDPNEEPTINETDPAETWAEAGGLAPGEVRTVAYYGPRRFVQPIVTKAGGSTGAKFSAVVVLGDPQYAPV